MKSSTYCSPVLIQYQVDDFVGDLTFQNEFMNTSCQISVVRVVPALGRRWRTIRKLTCWVCGTNPSTLEQEGEQAHQITETK